ncbi:protein RoBo-1-like [Mastomys coucha]|uniref:protein RoBo-1-like n=1 Tax=Mastomys coucha TaxID=35658 RepID=UPI001261B262|nr:protein RoBo-1-like [Mastomys coucha]
MGVTMFWFLILKSLLAAYIISHLSVSSVESYACIQKACTDKKYDPNPNTCESSKGCFFQRQEFEDPTLHTTEQRGCSADTCTELAFSATLGRCLAFRYDRRCCFTEQCNKEPIKVSPLSSEPNGVECPACYSGRGSVCKPVSLKCTGAETMCVNVTGRGMIISSNIQAMGCATRTACNLKNMIIMDNIKINTSCVNGNPPLSFQ